MSLSPGQVKPKTVEKPPLTLSLGLNLQVGIGRLDPPVISGRSTAAVHRSLGE